MQKLIPYFRILLTSWIGELLGWCGAALTGIGIHLSYEPGAPGAVADIILGLVAMALHAIPTHFTTTPAFPPTNITPTVSNQAAKGLKLVALFGLIAFAPLLTACSTFSGDTYTYTPMGSSTPVTLTGFEAWCENNLLIIRADVKSTIVLGVTIAESKVPASVTSIINSVIADVKAALVPLNGLLGIQNPSLAQIDSAFAQIKVTDPAGLYAIVIQPALNLVWGYIVQLESDSATAKVGVDLLVATIGGLNDAIAALAPTPSTTNAAPPTPVAHDQNGAVVYSF